MQNEKKRHHLDKLNQRHIKFINFILDGDSPLEAYSKLFDVSRMKTSTARVRASELRHDPLVVAELAARQERAAEKLAEKISWSKEESVKALKKIIQTALSDIANPDSTVRNKAAASNSATRAIEQINKMFGYNEPEKSDVTAKVVVELSGMSDYAD